MVEFPPFRLDLREGRLWRGKRPVALRAKAWALLRHLVDRPGALVTKDELHAAIWGDAIVSDDTLTRTIAEVRHALGDSARTPHIIETVHRRGFRFIGRLSESAPEMPSPASAAAWANWASPEPGFFVGRDAELEKLGALLRQAVSGHRQIVFIEGEPGIGKSATVDAFLDAARAWPEPLLIAYGQCVELYGEHEPYMPALEALERLSRGSSGEHVRSIMRAVAPSWVAQMPSMLKPFDAERRRRWHVDTTPHRMVREFAALVEAISSKQPLVFVLDDLHFSDQGTVDLVSVLAQRPEGARVMLIGTYRPAQAAALDHPIQQVLTLLRARRRCTEIALEYLTRTDVATYLLRRFDGARVDDDVAALVHAHSDGNPLFMVLLGDHLLARGWLADEGGIWRLAATHATIERDVPDNLRQLIEGQLRFVSPQERDVLEAASVAGVAFDAPAVAAGVGGAPGAVEAICHRFCRTERWLEHLGSREWPDGVLAARYAFRHALYRRALYEGLSPSRRATLHEQIGERLEAGYADRTAEVSSELATHFQGGRDHRRALVYLEQAATRAYDRRAYRDVIACLEPALRLLGEMPLAPERARDELRLRRLYAVVLSQTAGYASDTLFENLVATKALCEQVADFPALFDVFSELCLFYANAGDLVRAEEVAREQSRLVERLDEAAALQSAFLRGALALWSGKLADAQSLLGIALSSPVTLEDADRPYGVNPVVAARSFEALRRWIVGDAAGARKVQEEALVLAERHGRPFTIAHATAFGALVLMLDEDWTGAVTLATKAVELSEECGFPRWRGTALVIRGRALVERRAEDGALAEIRGGLDELKLTGQRLGGSLLLSALAAACLRADHLDEGLAAVDAGLAHCRDTAERVFEAELLRLRGECLRRRGQMRARAQATVPEAEACFEKARALARAQGALMLEGRISRGIDAVADFRRASR